MNHHFWRRQWRTAIGLLVIGVVACSLTAYGMMRPTGNQEITANSTPAAEPAGITVGDAAAGGRECIPPGQDCWMTWCGSGTQVDFSQNPIPADFFEPGSDPFDGIIALGNGTGWIDTVIDRLGQLCFTEPLPSTDAVPIELVQLNLASCAPITVGGSGDWDVAMALSGPQPQGTLQATKTYANGGTFTADFYVQPVFTFTRVAPPYDTRVFDTVVEGIPPIFMQTRGGAPWSDNEVWEFCTFDGFAAGMSQIDKGDPCCEKVCHDAGQGYPEGHQHCTWPPDCYPCPQGTGMLYAPTQPDNHTYRMEVATITGEPCDYFDARVATPTLEQLVGYRCVLTWVNYAYADAVGMGDVLADYVDMGGKVILGQWCEYSGQSNCLQGRIMTVGYCPVDATSVGSGSYMGDGTDCVHNGVMAYESGCLDLCTLLQGAMSDGTMSSGTLAVAFQPARNVYYSPGHTGGTFGTGDWAQLTANMCTCSNFPLYGACCDEPNQVCYEDMAAAECTMPSARFILGGDCADFDPPCGTLVAACCCGPAGEPGICEAYECIGDMTAATCLAVSEETAWYSDESCAGPVPFDCNAPTYCEAVGARSYRNHGSAGRLGLDMGLSDGIEPRLGGIQELEIDLAPGGGAAFGGTAWVSCSAEWTSGHAGGEVPGVAVGDTVTVFISPPLPNQAWCVVELDCGAYVCVRGLSGDIDRSGLVTPGDASIIKPKFAQTATAANAQYDYDVSGLITPGDFSQVKPRFGNSAPECGCKAHQDPWGTILNDTLPDNGTAVEFGSADIPPIPADFFYSGSDPFMGTVALVGSALDVRRLGMTDTMIQRTGPVCFPGTGYPRPSGPVELEIVELSLVAPEPMIVTGPYPSEEWLMVMGLSDTQAPGSLDATLESPAGGTFVADVPVTPLCVFVKVSDLEDLEAGLIPPEDVNVRIMDFGAEGIPAVHMGWDEPVPFSTSPPTDGFSCECTPCGGLCFYPGVHDVGVDTSPGVHDVGVDTSPGANPPPATLGGYTMFPFPPDPSALGSQVTSLPVPLPCTGAIAFDLPMQHQMIGSGWQTWSHTYTGDVYPCWQYAYYTDVVMTMPDGCLAIYFYVEPNDFGSHVVTCTANEGLPTEVSSGPIAVLGDHGAQYFGFYASGGDYVETVHVNVEAAASGFALGEFGIFCKGGQVNPPHIAAGGPGHLHYINPPPPPPKFCWYSEIGWNNTQCFWWHFSPGPLIRSGIQCNTVADCPRFTSRVYRCYPEGFCVHFYKRAFCR